MSTILARFGRDEAGATAIEYGLITSLVSLGIISAITSIGQEVNNIFLKVEAGFQGK